MKHILALLTIILFSISVYSQTDEAAARACLENYMSGDGDRMEKAFHSSASMKYLDSQTGEFKDVPIADFIARVKANTSKSERKIEIVSLNIEGNAASGKIRIVVSNARICFMTIDLVFSNLFNFPCSNFIMNRGKSYAKRRKQG